MRYFPLLLLAVLLLPAQALAVASLESYSRTPAGEIIEPGTVDFSWSIASIPSGVMSVTLVAPGSTESYGTCYQLLLGETEWSATDTLTYPTEGLYDTFSIRESLDTDCSTEIEAVPIEDSFTIQAVAEELPPYEGMPYKDGLFLAGVIIFLLSYPIWGRIFSL